MAIALISFVFGCIVRLELACTSVAAVLGEESMKMSFLRTLSATILLALPLGLVAADIREVPGRVEVYHHPGCDTGGAYTTLSKRLGDTCGPLCPNPGIPRIASIRVKSGEWFFHEAPNYAGQRMPSGETSFYTSGNGCVTLDV